MEWIIMSIPRPEDPNDIEHDMPEMWNEDEVEDDPDPNEE
jgi:hypothetical protein